jgi:hypothetical protein
MNRCIKMINRVLIEREKKIQINDQLLWLIRSECPMNDCQYFHEFVYCEQNYPMMRHAEYPAFSVGENFSSDTAGHMALIPMRARRQPISTVVYPCVLNRQRRAARQLLFVEDNARARWQWQVIRLPTSLLKITHCHCLHYCVGDGIMPERSNCSSRHDLSAMYPGVKLVWWSDAIPQVSLDMVMRRHVRVMHPTLQGYLANWPHSYTAVCHFIQNMCGCLGKSVGSRWASFWVMSKHIFFFFF